MADTEEVPTSQELGEQYGEIARLGGPTAISMVIGLLDQSAREQDSIRADVLKHTEQERDEWKAHALKLEEQLDGVQSRLDWIMRGGLS